MRERRPAPLAAVVSAARLTAVALLVAACGGGGDSNPPTAVGGVSQSVAEPAPGAPPAGTADAASARITAGAGCELSYTLTDAPLLTGADPVLARQWHLRNTGQSGGTPGEDTRATEAWAITRGAGVRVAVVDDAVELPHPELRPNAVEGASRSYRAGNRGSPWPVPCSVAVDDHGTAVAGLVLARDDNAVGGAGIAPRASLVAFDALAGGTDADIADALVRDSDANAVYQNSWGSPDDGRLHATDAAFAAAIRSGIDRGRGGRGSIFVFAGGNGGCYGRDTTGLCQVDDSNYDAYANRLGVIAVCAVDHTGRAPWYGEPGANLLVCGPSSGTSPNVTTTALRGGMRDDFSGTSASTPMVSGVVALMLSANPSLTWRDVRLILAETARRNDPGDRGWSSGPGGLAFHHRYGFGVVNAQAAVARALTWTSVGDSSTLRTCSPPERVPGIALPDAPLRGEPITVSDTLTVSGCGISRIEFVELRLTAPHAYAGDLRIRLTGPAGTTSELAETRLCPGAGGCGGYAGWRFGSSRHLNEAPNGTWTLQVSDRLPADTGRLERWSLVIHGR